MAPAHPRITTRGSTPSFFLSRAGCNRNFLSASSTIVKSPNVPTALCIAFTLTVVCSLILLQESNLLLRCVHNSLHAMTVVVYSIHVHRLQLSEPVSLTRLFCTFDSSEQTLNSSIPTKPCASCYLCRNACFVFVVSYFLEK